MKKPLKVDLSGFFSEFKNYNTKVHLFLLNYSQRLINLHKSRRLKNLKAELPSSLSHDVQRLSNRCCKCSLNPR